MLSPDKRKIRKASSEHLAFMSALHSVLPFLGAVKHDRYQSFIRSDNQTTPLDNSFTKGAYFQDYQWQHKSALPLECIWNIGGFITGVIDMAEGVVMGRIGVVWIMGMFRVGVREQGLVWWGVGLRTNIILAKVHFSTQCT